MLSDLSILLLTTREYELIPVMGGDINCRFGDLNAAFCNTGILYTDNIDTSSNAHGLIYGADLCNSTNIFPLNHLIHRQIEFQGDFTYFKGTKKSQIEMVYTTVDGLDFVKDFNICNDNWHFSDHRPIEVSVLCVERINATNPLRRARDLNYGYDPHITTIKRHTSKYDLSKISEYLSDNRVQIEHDILSSLQAENINEAIIKLDHHLGLAHKKSKVKQNTEDESVTLQLMEKANEEFHNYRRSLDEEPDRDHAATYERYQTARNAISHAALKGEHDKWCKLIDECDSKKTWERVDWKGNLSKQAAN